MRCGVVFYHRLLVTRGGLRAHWVPLNRTLSGGPANSPAKNDGGLEAGVKEGEDKDLAQEGSRIRPRLEIPKVTTRPLNFEEARDMAQLALEQQKKVLHQKFDSLKVIFGGQTDAPRTPSEQWYYKKVSFWMKRYENFVGLTEVKAAQARVVESEAKFIEVQQMRRDIQVKISDVQKRIKEMHLELEKTHRGEDRYLELVTQEHQVLKEEINLTEDFKFYEKAERDNFSLLSSSVRDSHEKERAQAEKTKYWSLIASVIGTCIGILGATINNRMRMNELRRLVSQNNSVEEIQAIGERLKGDFAGHQTAMASLVTEVNTVVEQAGSSLANLDKMEGLFSSLQESSQRFNTKELDTSMVGLQEQQEQLVESIRDHQLQQEEKVDQIHQNISEQMVSVSNSINSQQKEKEKEVKDRERAEKERKKADKEREWADHASEKRDSELMGRMNTLLVENKAMEAVVLNNIKDMEEKIKSVQTILTWEAKLPKFDTVKWTEYLERVEKRQSELIRAGFDGLTKQLTQSSLARQETLAAISSKLKPAPTSPAAQTTLPHNTPPPVVELGGVVELLDQQQVRTQQTVIMSAVLVALVTPITVFVFNKML